MVAFQCPQSMTVLQWKKSRGLYFSPVFVSLTVFSDHSVIEFQIITQIACVAVITLAQYLLQFLVVFPNCNFFFYLSCSWGSGLNGCAGFNNERFTAKFHVAGLSFFSRLSCFHERWTLIESKIWLTAQSYSPSFLSGKLPCYHFTKTGTMKRWAVDIMNHREQNGCCVVTLSCKAHKVHGIIRPLLVLLSSLQR